MLVVSGEAVSLVDVAVVTSFANATIGVSKSDAPSQTARG